MSALPYNQYGGATGGYVPTQFQAPGSAGFWGMLIDEQWMPSELFSRLSDAIFFYLDANPQAQYPNSGYIEPDKNMWWSTFVQQNHADQAVRDYIVKHAMASLYDSIGIPYQLVSVQNGSTMPILDRQCFLHSLILTAKVDPQKFLQKLNKSIATFRLVDPATNQPFPGMIPAGALPPMCDWTLSMAFQSWQITVGSQYQMHALQKHQKNAARKRMFGSAVSMLTGGIGGGGTGFGTGFGGI